MLLPSRAILLACLAVAPFAARSAGQECGRGPIFRDGFESGDTSRWSAPLPTPYRHVTPADVGVTIGPGVVAPVPTDPYTGPMTITAPTVVENVVVDGCLRIASDNVTIRNVIVQCGGLYPIKIENGSRNALIEYSRVTCGSMSKLFYVSSGARNARIAHNEGSGCEDLFFLEGDLDGLEIVDNYLHTLVGTPSSHADGFQIGEFGQTTGLVHVRGNYIDPDNATIGKNDIVFGTNSSEVHLVIEDNFFERWGHYTMRCGGAGTSCTIRDNVYSQEFAGIEQYLLLANAAAPALPAAFCCNRYADGTFVEEFFGAIDLVLGADHVITDCPVFAP